jgi:plasmid maintenance system killer protein
MPHKSPPCDGAVACSAGKSPLFVVSIRAARHDKQGRLPQELRHYGITDYEAANRYLEQHFIADFNRRFTVKPAQPESAFVKLGGIELELVLSSQLITGLSAPSAERRPCGVWSITVSANWRIIFRFEKGDPPMLI